MHALDRAGRGPERRRDLHYAGRMNVRRIVTVPPFLDREAGEGELVVRINVGRGQALAFGSGAHQTTKAALGLLGGLYADGAPKPRRVLDVGCGSGVLGIACALLGAEEILGVDVEPEAVEMSNENAGHNGVQDRCRYSLTPVADVPGAFDLVLANLPSAEVLRELAPALRDRARGGLLIASGIREDKRDGAIAAFTDLGLSVRAEVVVHGWCGALFR